MAKKPNIRKHDFALDGSHWDLSMLEIVDIPTNQLENNKKATKVDLSNNFIRYLDPKFPTLTHLVWLDLSKNQLTQLPEDFGCLIKLQHLDLYSNRLERLPLSFGELKRLRWLDLKDNALDPELKKVVGECRTTQECESCATRVVKMMKEISIRLELEKQRRQKEEEEEERKRRILEEKKAIEREKKKAKLARKKQKELEAKTSETAIRSPATGDALAGTKSPDNGAAINHRDGDAKQKKVKEQGLIISIIVFLFKFLLLMVAIFLGVALTFHLKAGNPFPITLDAFKLAIQNGVVLVIDSDIVQLLQELSSLILNKG